MCVFSTKLLVMYTYTQIGAYKVTQIFIQTFKGSEAGTFRLCLAHTKHSKTDVSYFRRKDRSNFFNFFYLKIFEN